MVFSSVSFLFYFLPVIIVVYNLAPCRLRNAVLLVSSLFFYAWGEPVYVFLMILSIVMNFVFGRAIAKSQLKSPHTSDGKLWVIIAIAANIGILGFFKYADFAIENLNAVFGTEIESLLLPLPIGISFYTFQALSYIIDLYRGQVRLQRNIVDFGTYVALFPQLIAGPIVRIKSIQEQLSYRPKNLKQFSSGIMMFAVGLAKKVLLANNIGLVWNACQTSFTDGTLSIAGAWLGAAAFTFQIYFDFSGYSDMAIGLGRMFGFEFPANFRYPYTSASITEFWRRWHISLSSWFKEYLYIPLGGNRKGLIKQIRNILIVWLLTGLWHGASWNFVVWGLYFGVLLIIEKMFVGNLLQRLPRAIGHVYALIFVAISWVIFASDDLPSAVAYIGNMFGANADGFMNSTGLYVFTSNMVLLIFCFFGSTEMPKSLWVSALNHLENRNLGLKTTFLILFLVICMFVSVAFMVSSTYNPFLYFRF